MTFVAQRFDLSRSVTRDSWNFSLGGAFFKEHWFGSSSAQSASMISPMMAAYTVRSTQPEAGLVRKGKFMNGNQSLRAT
jgi:hypothetical protein